PDELEPGRAAVDLGLESFRRGQLLFAGEADRADADDRAFGDVEDDARVARLVPFFKDDVGEKTTLLLEGVLNLEAGETIADRIERSSLADPGEAGDLGVRHVIRVAEDDVADDVRVLLDVVDDGDRAVAVGLERDGGPLAEQAGESESFDVLLCGGVRER